MTPDIALILGIDGIATGAIYVLVGLGLVLIFSVTRVVFVPFGDIAAFSALTLAAIQTGRLPGDDRSRRDAGVLACAVDAVRQPAPRPSPSHPARLLGYGVLPAHAVPPRRGCSPAQALPGVGADPACDRARRADRAALARVALRPIADASVLRAADRRRSRCTSCSPGSGLLFFGPEGRAPSRSPAASSSRRRHPVIAARRC